MSLLAAATVLAAGKSRWLFLGGNVVGVRWLRSGVNSVIFKPLTFNGRDAGGRESQLKERLITESLNHGITEAAGDFLVLAQSYGTVAKNIP